MTLHSEMQLARLLEFKDEVMAGCDIQKGDRLYRQFRVIIGPGKIQIELDKDRMMEFLHRFLHAANSHVELVPLIEEGEELLRGIEDA